MMKEYMEQNITMSSLVHHLNDNARDGWEPIHFELISNQVNWIVIFAREKQLEKPTKEGMPS